MENVKIIFGGTLRSKTDNHQLEMFANTSNEIYIEIDMEDFPPAWICFDKKTAIKLSKRLKSEIAKLSDYEQL